MERCDEVEVFIRWMRFTHDDEQAGVDEDELAGEVSPSFVVTTFLQGAMAEREIYDHCGELMAAIPSSATPPAGRA